MCVLVHADAKAWEEALGGVMPTPAAPVTLDTTEGKELGFDIMKNPATDRGPTVVSVGLCGVISGQAAGKIAEGTVILSINGKDVTKMEMTDIKTLLQSESQEKHFVFDPAGQAGCQCCCANVPNAHVCGRMPVFARSRVCPLICSVAIESVCARACVRARVCMCLRRSL